ncbi:MAG: VCBS domain-containing protein [Hyphomicrobium sp.]
MAILKTVKKIIGLSGQDYLTGGVAAEDIYGLTGDDTLRGNGGNDRLFGGIGKDTAVFSGKFADYNFANPAGGLQVTHARGTKIDGADFVAADVECLKFADITIDLTINHAPLAINDVNGRDVVRERGGLSNATAGDAVASGNVLANDSDIEVTLHRQTLRVANPGTYTGKFGTLTLNANGVWTYALNDADTDTQGLRLGQSATDAFFYTVSDGAGGTAVGKVTITIAGANDTPVAVADRNGTDTIVEAGGTANTLPGDPSATGNVLTNDTDIDVGDTKTVATAGTFTGVYGTLTLAANGTWTYTLKNADADTQNLTQGQSVNDVFTYTMKDTAGATSASTLSIKITGTNDAPMVAVVDVTGGVTEDLTPLGDLSDSGTIAFADADHSDVHQVSVTDTSPGALGVLSAVIATDSAGNGLGGAIDWIYSVASSAVEYLAEGETRIETFTIRLADLYGGTVDRMVSITITGANDAAVVAALSATISEDEPLSQDLLAGATDVDGDTLFVVDMPTSIISTEGRILGTGDFTVTGSTFALTTHGLAAFNALAENAADSFVFDFGVSDGSVTTQNAFSVTINGVNDAPEFTEADDTYDFGPINESQGAGVVVGTVAALDPDNGDSVLYAITGGDPAGHFTIDAATGEISTARTLDFETTASYALIVEARDRVSGGLTDVATVNISVGNVPETALPNASFELGFLNWSTDGSFATVTSTDAGGSSVVPTDGSYFAALSSDPTFGGTPITDAAIETFLGLAAGKLDTLTANNATDGSAIKTTAFLSAGQTLSFDYRFDSTDYLPYNDFAFFTIAPTFATKLADIQSVGDYGDSGWQTYTYVAPTSGTYTIGFGVVDTNDSGVASLLYLDDLRIV